MFVTGLSTSSVAQAYISSPYSMYGVGTLFSNISMANMAMGGTSVAYRSPYFINHQNPASYTAFDSLSFVFEGGLNGKLTTIRTTTDSYKDKYASLGYINMGFPITRVWKASLGLLPYSSMGYDIVSSSSEVGHGNTERHYMGEGGLNKAFIGNAIKLGNNFSAGLNLSYVFGTLSQSRIVSFPDSTAVSSRNISEAVVKDIYFDLGIQYYQKLKNNHFLNLGATFSPAQSLNATRSYYAYTFIYDADDDLDVQYDTIIAVPDTAGTLKLPFSVSFGLNYGKIGKWNIGADMQYQNWSKYSYFGQNNSLKNNLTISVGGQYKPSVNDLGKYWQRINYRAGFRYNSSHVELFGTKMNDFGISFGVGLPLKKGSTINLALETGTLGTTKNNLIKENYIKFTVGVSLYERWFLKRRYN